METVIAVGLTVFAVLSIVGLVAVGLGSYRSAMDLTVQGAVISTLAAEIRNGKTTATYYFDDQGMPSEQSTALYRASVNFEVAKIPGGGSNAAGDLQLTRARIEIFAISGGRRVAQYSLLYTLAPNNSAI